MIGMVSLLFLIFFSGIPKVPVKEENPRAEGEVIFGHGGPRTEVLKWLRK